MGRLQNMLRALAGSMRLGAMSAGRMPTVAMPAFQRSAPMCTDAIEDVVSGRVKWFDTTKGFGFIIPDDGSRDVFVHQTEIHAPGFRSLADGESVEYKVSVTDDGRMRAVDVTGPDGEYVQGAQRSMSHDDEY